MPSKSEIQEIIQQVIITREDIAFTHPIFMQCFLPHRALPKDTNRYQIDHGKASLVIRAGELVDPNNPGEWEKREIPAGPKARLLVAYINDRAIQTKSPVIDMGQSLRVFMERNRVPVGGKNGQEITRQAKNLGAAELVLGSWEDDRARQKHVRVASELSFWIEKNEKQFTLWTPELVLSQGYLEALLQRRVPVDFRALVALQANPRAMDVYCWLAYRMMSVRVPTHIPYEALHPVFGHGIAQLKHFKIEFKKALVEARKCYPDARLRAEKDQLILLPSKPAVPPISVRMGSPAEDNARRDATLDRLAKLGCLQEDIFAVVSRRDLGAFFELRLPVIVDNGLEEHVYKILREAKTEARNPPGYVRHQVEKLLTERGLKDAIFR